MHCFISWWWSCCEFPCTNKVRICSIDGLFCFIIRLKGPSTISGLHFRLHWLCWSGLSAVCQIRLVGWKQSFHFLWQFFTCCSTNELVSCLVSWHWSKVPSADEVCICSIDGLFRFIVRLKGPSAISGLHFRLHWLCWSSLGAICQIRFIAWKQIFHCLWQFLTCCTTDELMGHLISWRWCKVPCSNKVCIRSINRLFCLVVRLEGPSTISGLHFCLHRLGWSGLSAIC